MTPCCPACQSTSVFWLLHRVNGRGNRSSQRTLQWGCRACGHEWFVPVGSPEPTPPSASAAG